MDLTDITRSMVRSKEPVALKQLDTPWTDKALTSKCPKSEYPRPQFVRDSYISLNGIWGFCVTDSPSIPRKKDICGSIRVPFSPESMLSKVDITAGSRKTLLPHVLKPGEYLWYYRKVDVVGRPDASSRLLLHFGAVDQVCDVYINGHSVAHHEGGYLPFTIDVTRYSQKDYFDLKVCVTDVTDTSWLSRGKQTLNRGGMFYSAQSGIWQSVWMEWVPDTAILKVVAEPSKDLSFVKIRLTVTKPCDVIIRQIPDSRIGQKDDIGGEESELFEKMITADKFHPCDPLEAQTDHPIPSSDTIPMDTLYAYTTKVGILIEDAKLWTPENPYLYHIEIIARDEEGSTDKVKSYFGMRTYTMEQDAKRHMRFCLNHKPYFIKGVLDQGYWPDGLMTAPCDAALIYDIKTMKKLGFNTLRKHIKIEESRYYYHCDRLGMLVVQDMVSGGSTYDKPLVTYLPNLFPNIMQTLDDSAKSYKFLARSDAAGRQAFVAEMRSTASYLKNCTSIAIWTIFNEGWGQFDAATLPGILKFIDNTRPIDAASGWFDQGSGDFNSIHNYFRKPSVPVDKHKRACFLSECGGLTYYMEGHCASRKTYGYATYKSRKKMNEDYGQFIHYEILPLETKGLCGFIYTQVSDVEDEVNGILTYDRKVVKIRTKIW
ncbi:glycoside hydrolase family 2 protein [Butyrivibrio fibrisolvens]|uniref:glycoside hydrolase family 2 protein n=1 Tax=Butyrivibrio fibrisolvens TaxID=831 RepID=UPI0020BE56F8|nr:sugar-binding domain-containing protein [Butyrivibrio fibrisolvens]